MNKRDIIHFINAEIEKHPYQTESGMPVFQDVLCGIADANDQEFAVLQNEGVVGSFFKMPDQWIDRPKSVISIFFPYTNEVKKANATDYDMPSEEWLYARYEGHILLTDVTNNLADQLRKQGYRTAVPSVDPRFKASGFGANGEITAFNSNWSERHVAYVCGLGTFGLSRGLITEKGIAGRFSSIITDMELSEYEPRSYQDPFAYCKRCGACIPHCPVDAITLENGKDHVPCWRFIEDIKVVHDPKYGCGKCQVEVPCANGIPR